MKAKKVIFKVSNKEELTALKAIGKVLKLKFVIITAEKPKDAKIEVEVVQSEN